MTSRVATRLPRDAKNLSAVQYPVHNLKLDPSQVYAEGGNCLYSQILIAINSLHRVSISLFQTCVEGENAIVNGIWCHYN